MKVIIAGTRTFNDYCLLEKICNNLIHKNVDVEIVCGMAKGADTLGKIYAEKNGFKVKIFNADWDKYGKSAGPIRNKEMAKYADTLIAFWDGKSKGTSNMIDLAKSNNLNIHTIILDDSADSLMFTG